MMNIRHVKTFATIKARYRLVMSSSEALRYRRGDNVMIPPSRRPKLYGATDKGLGYL